MIFLTYWFAIFVVAFFAVYWLPLPPAARRLALLAGCLTFHAHFAGPAGMAPIIALAALTFVCGRIGGRTAPLVGIAASAAALIFFKYTMFLAEEVIGLIAPDLGRSAATGARDILPAAPPLAISFFVFEFVHYLVEVRRGGAPIRSPIEFALFTAFWPSLVAGPIKRYAQFLPSLRSGLARVANEDIVAGLLRIASGLVKKFAADWLTQYIDFWDDHVDELSRSRQLRLVLAIGLRILFDFSGYSDLAIGFGRLMGIRLPENFRWPYLAVTPVEFWRRWHISLSTWIRDYIYIPLGGSRHGLARRIVNITIAFALCGLWHGAGWNFVVWGLYHGAGLTVSTLAERALAGLQVPAAVRIAAAAASWLATTAFVFVGWIVFFYPLPRAVEILGLLLR